MRQIRRVFTSRQNGILLSSAVTMYLHLTFVRKADRTQKTVGSSKAFQYIRANGVDYKKLLSVSIKIYFFY